MPRWGASQAIEVLLGLQGSPDSGRLLADGFLDQYDTSIIAAPKAAPISREAQSRKGASRPGGRTSPARFAPLRDARWTVKWSKAKPSS